jgi:hypothetical protein
MQLVMRLLDTLAIGRINDKDQALRILIIMTPEGTDLVLSTDIPHGE